MILAKTDAAGGAGTLLPEVLSFSSSLSLDRALLKEDLVGSLAHVLMLGRQKVIPAEAARSIHAGLVGLWERQARGALTLPDEEDVHMAVEAQLGADIGAPSGLLHSARSRNDQVATDLRLHVREQCAEILTALAGLLQELVERARHSKELVLPSYTHRQRAQPISLAYWLASYGAAFARDADAYLFALEQADALALGVGAISGTSLNIDRDTTRGLLEFSRLTLNGLDTVGERDFGLDYAYASARLLVHAGRLSTDVIDFCTQEFGFAQLGPDIALGSSMMPHKKNPDVFELIRGKSGRAIGNLMGLLATVKGLPGGYNRDLQEDRAPLLETGPMVRGSLSVLRLALPRVTFDAQRCAAAVAEGPTQATDLAEMLVTGGMAFRTAYQKVGTLVRLAADQKLQLAKVSPALAATVDPAFTAEVLAVLDPRAAVARKRSAGSTGPASVDAQLDELSRHASRVATLAAGVPRLDALFAKLKETRP